MHDTLNSRGHLLQSTFLSSERPELTSELEKKDTDLLKRLENVYVTSKEPPVSGAHATRHAYFLS